MTETEETEIELYDIRNALGCQYGVPNSDSIGMDALHPSIDSSKNVYQKNVIAVVVTDGIDKIIGMVSLGLPFPTVRHIFVDPEYRRDGVAEGLMKFVFKYHVTSYIRSEIPKSAVHILYNDEASRFLAHHCEDYYTTTPTGYCPKDRVSFIAWKLGWRKSPEYINLSMFQ